MRFCATVILTLMALASSALCAPLLSAVRKPIMSIQSPVYRLDELPQAAAGVRTAKRSSLYCGIPHNPIYIQGNPKPVGYGRDLNSRYVTIEDLAKAFKKKPIMGRSEELLARYVNIDEMAKEFHRKPIIARNVMPAKYYGVGPVVFRNPIA